MSTEQEALAHADKPRRSAWLVANLQLGNAASAKLCLARGEHHSKRSFEEMRSQAGAWERER